jgi:hypothetical protein
MAVIFSILEYERLEKAQDTLWGMLAEKAEAEGFCCVEESEKFLESIRNAEFAGI